MSQYAFSSLSRTQMFTPEYLRDFVDSAPIGLYCVDENGVIVWANDAELEMMGYPADEFIGRSITEFLADQSKIADILLRLKRNETLKGYVVAMRRKDGAIRTVSINSNVFIENGRFIHTRCFNTDITEQLVLAATPENTESKHYGNVLASRQTYDDSYIRYDTMVAEVEDYAILSLDQNGFIVNWNVGAEKIKGYAANEIIGKHFSVFYRAEDRLARLPDQLINQARQQGKATHEGPRLRKDGTLFWGSIVITAIHNSEGRVIGFTKVTRDLSESKRKEEQIREYAAALEQHNKELEQFAYAASHDLKEPLRKIRFYMQAVADNAAGQLDQNNASYLERAVRAGRRMQKLIDDILEFTHTGAAHHLIAEIDPGVLVQEFTELNEEEIVEQQITVSCNIQAPLYGVHSQLRQLMHNLLGNAVKYRHKTRPLKIHVATKSIDGSQVPVDAARLDIKYSVLTVEDNGSGFDPLYADRIFDIFQRLHSKAVSGSGIGLAICKKVVQHHHGFITADATINHGAIFTVYLPLSD